MQHTYEPVGCAMRYCVDFRTAADWFTEDDGQGAWSMLASGE